MKTKLTISFIILCMLCFVGCYQERFVRKQAICPTIPGANYVGDESCSDHDQRRGPCYSIRFRELLRF